MGHPPENVRVELAEMEQRVVVVLQDDEGIFLECQPEEEQDAEDKHVAPKREIEKMWVATEQWWHQEWTARWSCRPKSDISPRRTPDCSKSIERASGGRKEEV